MTITLAIFVFCICMMFFPKVNCAATVRLEFRLCWRFYQMTLFVGTATAAVWDLGRSEFQRRVLGLQRRQRNNQLHGFHG